MSLNVDAKGGTDFELVPAGLYVARCYRVLDLGTQTTNGMFGQKEQHQIMVSWELLDDEVKMKDGRPFSVHKTYTASLNEKAKLREHLESWRGIKFTDQELESFNLTNIVGTFCQVQVIHSNDGKFANVQNVVSYKPPKDKDGNKLYPEQVNPDLVFDIDEPDMVVFDLLSDNMKAKIMGAPEWEAAKKKAESKDSEPEPEDPFDSDTMPDNFLQLDDKEPEVKDEITEVSDDDLDNVKLPDMEENKKKAAAK
jgi:hypothetical protein